MLLLTGINVLGNLNVYVTLFQPVLSQQSQYHHQSLRAMNYPWLLNAQQIISSQNTHLP